MANTAVIFRIVKVVLWYGMAQLLLVVSAPILTRLYAPNAFGYYGYVLSYSLIFVPLLSLRYEYAIPLIKKHQHQNIFTTFCQHLVLFNSLILSVLFLLYYHFFYHGHIPLFSLLLTYTIVLFQTLVQVQSIPLISRGKVGRVAFGKFIQNTIMVALQILLPLLFFPNNPTMLIISLAIGLLCNYLYYSVFLKQKTFLSSYPINKAIAHAKSHYRFPLYSSWSSFLDGFSTSLPIFFIGSLYGATQLGLYFLVYRVFSAPTGLLSKAVSQVLIKEFSDNVKDSKKMSPLFLKLTAALLIIAAGYFVMMLFLSHYAVQIFGAKWQGTDTIIRDLAYIIPLILCVSPLSVSLLMIKKNNVFASWQVAYILGTFITLFLFRHHQFNDMLQALVILWVCLYIIYWLLMYIFIHVRDKSLCVE